MFTQSTNLALQALLVIGSHPGEDPISPDFIAERVACSPSYLRKVLGLLSRGRVLGAVRGKHGGFRLARAPGDIRLREVVEACEGAIREPHCPSSAKVAEEQLCGFHRAMRDVHHSTTSALERWTLADLLSRPAGHGPAAGTCLMRG